MLASERQRRFRLRHPGQALEWTRKWQKENREKHLLQRRERRLKNRIKENERTKQWRKAHVEHVRAYDRKYRARRMQHDTEYCIREKLRTRIRQAIKDQCGIKAMKSCALLGCSIPDFRIYIESKFEHGMTWENWGHGSDKWNLDHIIPCSIFNLSKEDHQKRCFHFSNYQPMWQPQNFQKSNKHYSGQLSLL